MISFFIYIIRTAILHDASKEKHLHVHEVTGHSECCLYKQSEILLQKIKCIQKSKNMYIILKYITETNV